jgi:hypothetical protein
MNMAVVSIRSELPRLRGDKYKRRNLRVIGISAEASAAVSTSANIAIIFDLRGRRGQKKNGKGKKKK